MELDNIKLQTTWNDAAGSINSNFQKIKQALATNGGGGGTADIVIDTAMSDTSDNAVANKVIKAYVDNAINDIDLPQDSEYITVKEGVISLDVDSQGGLGNTGQGLGIVAIPTSIMTGIEQYVEEEIEGLADDINTNPKTYIQLKTINGMEIYGEGNIAIEGGSSEGTSGLTAINVNSQSFQPDSDGIVTLPNYRPLNYYNQDLAKKVDKVDGKGLSTNDYTTADKDKLAGIAAGAEVNVQSDWNATSGDAFIKNKPNLSVVATSGSYGDLINTPRFAVVATSGSYNDLLDKPTIPVEVTETTVAGWGFTKNTGTYIKPTTGIPKSHLASGVQTSLGLADTALQEGDLDDYPTKTEVGAALTEALKNYALAQDLAAVDGRLADVEAFFDSKDDKDSLVNKWHEIVTFLDATEGDTLDSILETYAKDADLNSAVQRITANETTINTHTSQINNHATRLSLVEGKATNNATAITNIQKLFTDGKANKAIADGNGNNIVNTYATKTALATTNTNVTANADAISTLQGYFTTSGVANNADKLDGYDSSYFATAANLNNLTGRVSTAEGEIEGLQANNTTLMAWYNSVGKYFKYDSDNDAWYLDGDFYTTGQNAAGGAGEEDGGGSGIILDYASIVEALGYVPLKSSDLTSYLTKTAASTTYATITTVTALTNRVSALEGKATAVSFSQTLTSGKEIGRLTIDGSTKTLYAPSTYAFSELTSKPTTLSGYGITDAIVWDTDIDASQDAKYRHIGYGQGEDKGWYVFGPAIAFGANSSYYAQMQAMNSDQLPYLYFRSTSAGKKGDWYRFLFDKGNENISSKQFSIGDYSILQNYNDEAVLVNHGGYTSANKRLVIYGRTVEISVPNNAAYQINGFVGLHANNGVVWDTGMNDTTVAYTHHMGYAHSDSVWSATGPTIAFGTTGNYTLIQAVMDKTDTPDIRVSNVYGSVQYGWARIMTFEGMAKSDLDVARYYCKGENVLYRPGDATTYLNYGPAKNATASLYAFGEAIHLNPNQANAVYINNSTVLHSGNINSYTAGKANQLATSRKLWGQYFDGTADVSGNMENVGKIVHSYANAYNMDEYGNFYSSANSDSSYWNFKRSDGNPALAVYALSGLVQTHYDTTLARYGGTVLLGGNAYNLVAATIYGTLTVTGATSLNSTLSVSGLASFNKGIQIEYGQSIAFVGKDGVAQYITLDEENGAIKVIGNFFATGQNAAGGAGGEELGMLTSWENIPTNLEGVTLSASLGIDLYNNSKKVLTSWDDIPEEGDEGYEDFVLSEYTVSADLVQTMNDEITTLKNRTTPSAAIIKLTNLCSAYTSGTSGIAYSSMDDFITWTVFNSLRDGIAIKVSDTSSSKKRVWNYSVDYTASGYKFRFTLEDKYVEITSSSTDSFTQSTYTITHNL